MEDALKEVLDFMHTAYSALGFDEADEYESWRFPVNEVRFLTAIWADFETQDTGVRPDVKNIYPNFFGE